MLHVEYVGGNHHPHTNGSHDAHLEAIMIIFMMPMIFKVLMLMTMMVVFVMMMIMVLVSNQEAEFILFWILRKA